MFQSSLALWPFMECCAFQMWLPPLGKAFDPAQNLLQRHIHFAYPGVHVQLKWDNTLQAHGMWHYIQRTTVINSLVCPTKTFQALLSKVRLPPNYPLSSILSLSQLKSSPGHLYMLNIPLLGYSFQAFRHLGPPLLMMLTYL